MNVYYGAFLNLRRKSVLVVGGGKVGERKVKKLLEAKATIVVVSPVVTPYLHQLAESGSITHRAKAYDADDLADIHLVFAATNRREVNQRISIDAHALGIWRNIADDKEACDLIVPASTQIGDVHLAISTHGNMPDIAKSLRIALEADINDGGVRFYDQLKDLLRQHKGQDEDKQNG